MRLFIVLLSLVFSSVGGTFTSPLITSSSQTIEVSDDAQSDEEPTLWAVENVWAQSPLDLHIPRVSKRSTEEYDIPLLFVSQAGPCWTIRWEPPLSPPSYYKIYRSTNPEEENDEEFHFVETVPHKRESTIWKHCCRLSGITKVRFGVSAVDSSKQEHEMKKSDPVVVSTSFLPAGPLPEELSPRMCCVRDHVIAYNPKDDNFLLVIQCRNGSLYSVLVDSAFKASTRDITFVTNGEIDDQGSPSVTYNQRTMKYTILLQLRAGSRSGGKYVIVSRQINGATGEFLERPSVVAQCQNKKEQPEDCRKPKIIYNLATYGYIMTMEASYMGLLRTVSVLLSSEAKMKGEIQRFNGKADFIYPNAIYEPSHNSVLFLAQADKKYCEKTSACSGYAIFVQRYVFEKGLMLKRCVIGSTWAKVAAPFAVYDENENRTIVCFTKQSRNRRSRLACYFVGYVEVDVCFSQALAPFDSYSSHPSRDGSAIYYPPGNALFSAWSEEVGSSSFVRGHQLERERLGRDVSSPVAIYREKTKQICIAYRSVAERGCDVVKIRCLESSSSCIDCLKNNYQACDPCSSRGLECSKDATCKRTGDKYSCQCKLGFVGNGTHCSDVRECSKNGQKKDGKCACNLGYVGNGKFCCKPQLKNVWNVPKGNSATLECSKTCMNPYLIYDGLIRFSWLFRGRHLNETELDYSLSNDGAVLTVRKLTQKYFGSYTCRIDIDNDSKSYKFYTRIDAAPTTQGNCRCGEPDVFPNDRIIGGSSVRRGEFPWQAMLCNQKTGVHCGGVMISPCCILTAAHCFTQLDPDEQVTVCLGKVCGSCANINRQRHQCFVARNTVIHPEYDRVTLANDIALVKIDAGECLSCESYARPICLPQPSRDEMLTKIGKAATVSGWGETAHGKGASDCLRKGHVNFMPINKCNESFSWPQSDYEYRKLCTTDQTGACGGDSGGPLMMKNKKFGNRWILAGLVSYGYKCGSKDHPGVYTRVDKFLDWIYDNCSKL